MKGEKMDREIKFRGRDIETGEWHYGDLLQYRVLPVIFDEDCEQHEVSAETVGQYTGMYDKNGVEIYEGDILRFDSPISKSFVIEWNDTNGAWTQFSPRNRASVIGNIHENPELLNGKGGES